MLRVYTDWNNLSKEPSSYSVKEDIISINPKFYSYKYFKWFIPFIHESGHWFLHRFGNIFTDKVIVMLNTKLDDVHSWLMNHLTNKVYTVECYRYVIKNMIKEDKDIE